MHQTLWPRRTPRCVPLWSAATSPSMEACWPATASSRASPPRLRTVDDEKAAVTLLRGIAQTTAAAAADLARTRVAAPRPRLIRKLYNIILNLVVVLLCASSRLYAGVVWCNHGAMAHSGEPRMLLALVRSNMVARIMEKQGTNRSSADTLTHTHTHSHTYWYRRKSNYGLNQAEQMPRSQHQARTIHVG